ncbi:hypothetical protein [Tenacibaculum caenipelagi]|uniref:Uncharacterized protein n=1 Tax=Tenacibaculum caenipelagi TaxID=1325435 RepID=A0A4R6TAW8_9FLAO|nr:hypothetical protein [Tenacibaculum caenipelagi]TDQ23768.1 hypothetical protein DFQ07_2296 [Tenacibaculum caenipelagi]
MIKQIIEFSILNPKKLFLIDGFGATLSALLLGLVLVKYESVFGIPPSTLYLLALLPVFFIIYDFYCYFKKGSKKQTQFLKRIALINLLYCCLSIGAAFYHSKTITNLGWTYILVEVLIIIVLAIIEFTTAKRLTKKLESM